MSRDGRYLYASNRGADTVAVFAIDRANGRLEWRGSVPAGGRTPRFFALKGDAMFVANEEGHNIVRFSIGVDGRARDPVVVAETGSPTSIVFGG